MSRRDEDGEPVYEILHDNIREVKIAATLARTAETLDLLARARDLFLKEPGVAGHDPVVLAEMTLRSLGRADDLGHADFLARAGILRALGLDVLISRFGPYYELAEYLVTITDRLIGMAVGLPSVRDIADEQYYTGLPGGVLEAAGRLFKRPVKMYVYPTRAPRSGEVQSVERSAVPPPWHHLRDFLVETGAITPIRDYDERYLSIRTPDVLARIQAGDESWVSLMPTVVAQTIKAERLFGYREPTWDATGASCAVDGKAPTSHHVVNRSDVKLRPPG